MITELLLWQHSHIVTITADSSYMYNVTTIIIMHIDNLFLNDKSVLGQSTRTELCQ